MAGKEFSVALNRVFQPFGKELGERLMRMNQSVQRNKRILHTSDLHLECFGDRACHDLEAVINTANMNQIDLLIIAGDLFDHNRIKDNLIEFVRKQLQRLLVPAVILPGNHDCLIEGSVHERASFWQDCDEISIFKDPQGEIKEFRELGITLWGKAISTYDEDVRPLGGIPIVQESSRWNIAVAHGHFLDVKASTFPSYHITQDEIANTGWDYYALGHIPVFKCVSENPMACYPGSPSLSGTGLLVELAEAPPKVRVFPIGFGPCY
jgi:hypothetical protein